MKEVHDLLSFSTHLQIKPSLHAELDVRETAISKHIPEFEPFRHRIYAISVYSNSENNQANLFFKIPYQILTAESKPDADHCFYIAFSDLYLSQHTVLSTLIFDLPFLRVDQAAPLTITETDLQFLKHMFDLMKNEYQNQTEGWEQMVASYLHTYLLHIRRIFMHHHQVNMSVIFANQNDLVLTGQFQFLLDNYFKLIESQNLPGSRSVKYYAEQLAVHPNYLNAAIKRATGSTAQQLLQRRLISLSKSMLSQTNLSVKEISYKLAFNEPAHFSNFFKKYTSMTPGQFRESLAIKNMQ